MNKFVPDLLTANGSMLASGSTTQPLELPKLERQASRKGLGGHFDKAVTRQSAFKDPQASRLVQHGSRQLGDTCPQDIRPPCLLVMPGASHTH